MDKIIFNDTNTYFNKALIKPPTDPNQDFSLFEKSKYTRTFIDSFTRNKTLYPKPNNYEIELIEDINDVISAELGSVRMPKTNYIINSNFNTLHFNLNGTDYISTIPTGSYTESTLASAIQTTLNATVGSAAFTVTFMPGPNTIKFETPLILPFVLSMTVDKSPINNNLAPLLGFNYDTYSSTVIGSYNTITSPFPVNINYNDYIVMYISQFDSIKSSYSVFDRSFAIISNDSYTSNNIADTPKIMKVFNPPLARLLKIKVKFLDKYGNFYDFNNQDHRFELFFKSYKQRLKI